MALPFFESSSGRLDELVKPGMLCAFDFDGTLAPIIADPDRVSVPAAVARRLGVLAEHATIAIISGRAAADVRARLDFDPHFVVGNHGLEGCANWNSPTAHYAALCTEWEKRLAALLIERRITDPGIRLENKGVSLSLHYRLARNRTAIETQLRELLADLVPPAHIIDGKCVFNVLPAAGIDKGVAIIRLMEESKAAGTVYVGDDVTDEDVFRLRRNDILTVRVEPTVRSHAEFFLRHRVEIVQLLDELILRLRKQTRATQAFVAARGT